MSRMKSLWVMSSLSLLKQPPDMANMVMVLIATANMATAIMANTVTTKNMAVTAANTITRNNRRVLRRNETLPEQAEQNTALAALDGRLFSPI